MNYSNLPRYHISLVVWIICYFSIFFPYIGNVIIPIDEPHIFQRGRAQPPGMLGLGAVANGREIRDGTQFEQYSAGYAMYIDLIYVYIYIYICIYSDRDRTLLLSTTVLEQFIFDRIYSGGFNQRQGY